MADSPKFWKRLQHTLRVRRAATPNGELASAEQAVGGLPELPERVVLEGDPVACAAQVAKEMRAGRIIYVDSSKASKEDQQAFLDALEVHAQGMPNRPGIYVNE